MRASRRETLTGLAAALLYPSDAPAAPASSMRLGPPAAFSFEAVIAKARASAAAPFRPPPSPPGGLDALDFDAMGQIRYRPTDALLSDTPGADPVRLFHLSRYARTPVTVHVVQDGEARTVSYSEDLFEVPAALRRGIPPGLAFAGFRVMNGAGESDWLAFQGASYFRSALPFDQYGLSARGVAIDTASAGLEEFPAFTDIWLEYAGSGELVVTALVDGPSLAGAYRIVHRKSANGLVQEIDARLAFRRSPRRLGLAPLTSMYWYGPADGGRGPDWRPQIHDSDGLALWTGAGERIWRPLANPPRVVTNAFADRDPRGFGLVQRDRLFADYQDDGAFYDRRPSAWVEPLDPWGPGSVQLVEIPTASETDDNIVAFWTPESAPAPGQALALRYRLHWCDEEPFAPGLARVVATRVGQAGRPGQPPTAGARKLVVDFEGGRLAALKAGDPVQAVAEARPGPTIGARAYPVVGTRRWRLMFDAPVTAGNPTDLRAFLRLGSEALTETWIYQVFGGPEAT